MESDKFEISHSDDTEALDKARTFGRLKGLFDLTHLRPLP